MNEYRLDIAITAHSGTMHSVWTVIGVPPRSLEVSELNILVVRVTRTEKTDDI